MTTIIEPKIGLAFRVEAKQLAAAVGWVAKRIPGRPTNPTLGGVKLAVANGTLTVAAFDYDISSEATIDVLPVDAGDDVADGQALVSGRLLAELVKTLPDKPVTIAADAVKATITWGSVRSTLTLPAMPIEDYPTLPEQPGAVGTVDAATFVAAVKRTAFAAWRDGPSNPPSLIGAHLRFDGDHIQIEATNRWRGAISRVPWAPVPGVDIAGALPVATALLDIADALSDRLGDIELSVEPGAVIGIAGPGRRVTARMLADPYPPLPSLFPARSDSPATVDVADLTATLNRAKIVGASAVRLSLSSGELTVFGGADGVQAVNEPVACAYTGPDIAVGANPQYFTEGLAALRSDVAEISLTTPRKPILLTASVEAAETYRYLLMPVGLDHVKGSG